MDNRFPMVFVADVESHLPETISNSFQKYTQIKALKEGGKAQLYVCKDTNLGRQVVLKMLRPDLENERLELRRLIREAKITAQLSHPATVPMYELGQDDQGRWYFATKRILGHTLFDIIVSLAKREPAAEKEFDLNRLLSILTQVGDALAYAHALGVIHRDVKPENIIVGRFGEVTLIDWGSAKVWGMPNEAEDGSPEERTGTPLYMSPEQVSGRWMVDERTDVYSLGVVMYEMMAQREPFRGANIRETFANITSKEPIKPSEAAPHRFIPQELEQICLKAMAREPSARFQSMRIMMEEINEFRNKALLRGSL